MDTPAHRFLIDPCAHLRFTDFQRLCILDGPRCFPSLSIQTLSFGLDAVSLPREPSADEPCPSSSKSMVPMGWTPDPDPFTPGL